MGTEITLTIPDNVYEYARQVAKSRQQEVAEVLTEAIALPPVIDENLSAIPDEDFERERAAFLAMHPTLLRDYFGYYVAFYEGEMVDKDRELAELAGRIRRRYSPAFVLIRKVETEPERTYYFRSPRFVQS